MSHIYVILSPCMAAPATRSTHLLHGWKIFVHYYNRINIIRTHHLNLITLISITLLFMVLWGAEKWDSGASRTVCCLLLMLLSLLRLLLLLLHSRWFFSTLRVRFKYAHKNRKGMAYKIKGFRIPFKSNDQFLVCCEFVCICTLFNNYSTVFVDFIQRFA